SVNFSANTVVTRQGSVIDLSGGSLSYQGGYVRSSALIDPNGNIVPIELATPGVAYLGIASNFVVNHSRWGVVDTYSSPFARVEAQYEPGYVQGGNAGSLTVGTNTPTWWSLANDNAETPGANPSATASFRIFDGQIKADTVVGPKQVGPNTGSTDPTQTWQQQPLGATLNLQNAGNVSIVADAGPQLGASFGPLSAVDPSLQYQVRLPEGWFNGSPSGAAPTPGVFKSAIISSGFDPDISQAAPAQVNRAYGGYLTIPVGIALDLGDGGSFAFTGTGADVSGTILAPGGKVSLSTLQKPSAETLQSGVDPNLTNTVHLSSTGVIDVAGRLTNVFLDGLQGPTRALNGGSVVLTGANVILDPGSLVDVSGGAEINAAGTKLTAGKGGAITINVSQAPVPTGLTSDQLPPANLGTLVLGGTLSGYALGQGGSLAIKTGYDVVIGDSLPSGDVGATYRLFTPDFFTQGGFSSYQIVGDRSLTVTAGTVVTPSTESLTVPSANGSQLATGTRLDDALAKGILPQDLRNPMSLTLSTLPSTSATAQQGPAQPDLFIAPGATIQLTDYPGSTLQLASHLNLTVDGTIQTPGGNISLTAQSQGMQGSVILGASARLLANGYESETPAANNQFLHSVQPGGNVSITSDDAVQVNPGAVIDVSGVHGVADLPTNNGNYAATAVDGSAGSISISATSGLVAGTLLLRPGGPSGLGGSLTISRSSGAALIVTQSVPASSSGQAGNSLTVVADTIDASGADDLTLQTIAPSAVQNPSENDAILFQGSVNLQTRNSITLLAPVLGTYLGANQTAPSSAVTLSSGYVDLQGQAVNGLPTAGAADLNGTLTVRANLIDVARTLVLGCISGDCRSGGFGAVNLVSTGDIRLSDRDEAGNASQSPGLLTPGALALTSAQVYVTSRQETGDDPLDRPAGDPGFLVQSAEKISIVGTSNATPPPVPQSFGERLTLEAPVIDQAGVLRAPQGQLFLVGTGANGSVTLEPGSLTSASLGGTTVAFGPVQTGGSFPGYVQPGEGPTKSVNLAAANVSVLKGAVIDVSGGGDLQGYIWTSGDGGTQDVLSTLNGFAVVPSIGTSPLPVAPVSALTDPRLKVGDTIWLQGVPGLPDGSYTLLPAHYALLPGGFLVVPQGGSYASAAPTSYRPDGAVVASGYEERSGNPGYSRFLVMSHDVIGEYSQFTTYSFDEFATELASQAGIVTRTPNDAGTVVLNAADTLVLQGAGRFGAGPNGLLGNLDVSAPLIAVLGAGVAAPTDSTGASYVTIDLQSLENFGAGSVLIGGTRAESTTTDVTVNAQKVFVSTGGSVWTGPEILLAATDTVTVADGSSIRASAPSSGSVSLDT
ncbi:MAG TPA: hypothetical protein VMH90_02805, partial [Thermoplasmata archaeon]|nr:hypothetical protein [Thermoplasmata archaeon]